MWVSDTSKRRSYGDLPGKSYFGRYESEHTLMMWGYGFSWGGMTLMLLGMTLWIALLVVLVWALVRWLNRKTGISTPPDTGAPFGDPSALEILRQRYARGEIDATTFEHMRERLEAPNTGGYQYNHQPVKDAR